MALTSHSFQRYPRQVGNYSSATVGNGTKLAAGTTSGLASYADDGGAVATGELRAVLGRVLLGIDQSSTAAFRGAMGHIRLNNGIDLSSTAEAQGTEGYLELAGTHTAGATAVAVGLKGSVAIATALTVTAGGKVAGVLAHVSGAGTTTGVTAGFLTSYSTAKWTIGLYIPVGSAVQAIRVGNFVTGGETTGGIAFNTTLDTSGGGGWGDGQLDVISAHGASAADLGSGYSAKVGRFRHIIYNITCAHETYGAVGQVVAKTVTFSHIHAGLMGTFEVQTAATVPSGAGSYICCAGIVSRVGGATITVGSTGFLAGIVSMQLATVVSITSGGIHAAFACCKTTTGVTWAEALYIQDALVAIRCYAADDAYAHGIKVVAAAPAGNTSHALKIMIGTTPGYIPVYDAETF